MPPVSWVVPPSPEDEEEEEDKDEASAPGGAQAIPACGSAASPPRRCRGRPPGIRGSHTSRSFRDKALREHDLLECAAAAPQCEANVVAAPPQKLAHLPHPNMWGLRPSICEPTSHLIMQSLARDVRATQDPELQRFVAHFFASRHAPILPQGAAAQRAGMTERTFGRRLHQFAAAMHWAFRAWLSSLLMLLQASVATNIIRGVAEIEYTQIDETPLYHRGVFTEPLGLGPPVGGQQQRQALMLPQPQSVSMAKRGKSAQVLKVVQSRCDLVWLLQAAGGGRMQCWIVPMSTPLQVVSHGTGETIKSCIDEHWDIPGMRAARELFQFTSDAYTADRAASNQRAFEGRAVASDREALQHGCSAHDVSTSQGRAMNSAIDVVKGVIAMSLAMKPGGSLQTLRRQLAEFLYYRVQLIDAPAPSLDSPGRRRFQSLLDVTIPNTVAGIRRRHELLSLFTSDVDSEDIFWHCPGLLWDRWSWAVRAALAILPHKAQHLRHSSTFRWPPIAACLGSFLPRARLP